MSNARDRAIEKSVKNSRLTPLRAAEFRAQVARSALERGIEKIAQQAGLDVEETSALRVWAKRLGQAAAAFIDTKAKGGRV